MAIQAALQANMAAQAQKFGLSVSQSAIAQDLGQHPGSSLQEVCDRLGWPKSTVSRLVDELVQRKMVVRQVPESNRRTVVLSLDHASVGCVPTEREVFPGGLPDAAELEALVASLDKILGLLKSQ